MFQFFQPKSCLGVDLGAGGVKLVELRQEKNRPVLFTYGLTTGVQNVHHLEEVSDKTVGELTGRENVAAKKGVASIDEKQVEEYSSLIKEICKASKVVGKHAVVSLPVSAVFHAIVNLPKMKKEEFNLVLRAEVKKLMPRPLEEMALDYQVLPSAPDAKADRVLVNAVPKTLVSFYAKVFQKAGLVLDALEPESTALARSLVGKDNAINLVIDIGAERTNFFIIDQAVPVTHHSIETGGGKMNKLLRSVLGIEDVDAEQIKQDLSIFLNNGHSEITPDEFIKIFAPVIEPIMKEIEVSFDLYLRQSINMGRKPEKIILTGGGSMLPHLSTSISERFKIKCFVGDPWARVVYQEALKPVLHRIAPRMSVAIGLALRNMV